MLEDIGFSRFSCSVEKESKVDNLYKVRQSSSPPLSSFAF